MRRRLFILLTLLMLLTLAAPVAAVAPAGRGGGVSVGGRGGVSSGARSSGSSAGKPASSGGKSSSAGKPASSSSSGAKTAPTGKPAAMPSARSVSATYRVSGPSAKPAPLKGYTVREVRIYEHSTLAAAYGVPYYPPYLYLAPPYSYPWYAPIHVGDPIVWGCIDLICGLLIVAALIACFMWLAAREDY